MKIIVVSTYSPKWLNIASIRWEKISKYLSQNHDVYLLTSSFPGGKAYRDYDLGKARLIEIPLKFFLRNPYIQSEYRNKSLNITSFLGRLKPEISYIMEFLLPYSPGGVLIHDVQRYFEELNRIITTSRRRVVLITSYDPWFTLRLGKDIKKIFREKVIWIADFRDPSFNVHESLLSRLKVFRSITCSILKTADMITVVSKTMLNEYRRCGLKTFFIPNGFDGEIIYPRNPVCKRKNELRIVYTGSVHPGSVDLRIVFRIFKKLNEFCQCNVKFTYAGKDWKLVDKWAKDIGIEINNMGLVNREKALDIQRESDLLLAVAYTGKKKKVGIGLRTGKIYEYIASGKPILVIGPKEWEMRDEIESDGISKVLDPRDDEEEILRYLKFLAESDKLTVNSSFRVSIAERYHYSNIAKEFEVLLLLEALKYDK